MIEKFICPICKKEMEKLCPAHANVHNMTMREMVLKYGIVGDVCLSRDMINQDIRPRYFKKGSGKNG